MSASLALSLAGPLNAQQTRDLRSDPEASITVTGTRLTREQARERAVEFVRQIGVARGQQAAARWIDPVCPRVRGITERYAGVVEARMRAIATEVGMRVAPEGCRSNVSVSFVGDAEALMREIDRRSPTRLREVPVDARDALVNGDAPVRWWYLTGTRSRHATRETSQYLVTESGGAGGPGQSVASSPFETEALSHYDSSVISTQVNRAIVDANVVIDLDRVEGMSLEAIAAYAAFVAFVEVRTSDPRAPGSILGLFSTDPEGRSLTDWDMTFLRSLYRLPLDRPARRHRGMLVRDMVNAQTPG
ncbi:MAG: hypothetical protein ACT4N8_09750 [Sphingosinicella sp.]|uniref:hypothetical protein n=1 Tax=Sphingosinicella sp. TaxID=1917971 RepID=UPI0040377EFC